MNGRKLTRCKPCLYKSERKQKTINVSQNNQGNLQFALYKRNAGTAGM